MVRNFGLDRRCCRVASALKFNFISILILSLIHFVSAPLSAMRVMYFKIVVSLLVIPKFHPAKLKHMNNFLRS